MATRSPWTCILWDVDGTIVDASDGILRRLTVALEHFGKPKPTRAELVHWIGPPMYESFQTNVGMSPEQATEAVVFYRAGNEMAAKACLGRMARLIMFGLFVKSVGNAAHIGGFLGAVVTCGCSRACVCVRACREDLRAVLAASRPYPSSYITP